MNIKIENLLKILSNLYPNAACSLEYGGCAWKLLIMTRLSAQCTDARVNIVCKELFSKFPTLLDLANGELLEIEKTVFTCGLYKTKAKSIKEASKILCEKYNGEIPDSMEELLALPGVGRKTANLVLGDIFGKGGIVADTHCIRISNRLELANSNDPLIVERTLDAIVPKEEQNSLCHRFVLFGREYCKAKNPQCEACPLKENKICNFV